LLGHHSISRIFSISFIVVTSHRAKVSDDVKRTMDIHAARLVQRKTCFGTPFAKVIAN
jgi:hypothetical protein